MSGVSTAFVLAAGLGERMRPLTTARAKSTLPILGEPLLARILAHLRGHGFDRLVVNAFHAQTSVTDVASRFSERGPEVFVSEEESLMGTAGALAGPREILGRSEWFLIHNGDTLVDDDFESLRATAVEGGHAGALLVRRGATPRFGALSLREDLLAGVVAAREVDRASGELATYLGVAVLHRDLLDLVPDDRPTQLFGDLLLPAIAAGRAIATCATDGSWLEFTSPGAYRENLTRLVVQNRERGFVPLPGGDAPVEATAGGALFVAEGGEVHRSATIEGGVILERGARVAPCATLDDAILLEDAAAGSESTLRRAVVDRCGSVPDGTEASDGTFADDDGELVRHPFA